LTAVAHHGRDLMMAARKLLVLFFRLFFHAGSWRERVTAAS